MAANEVGLAGARRRGIVRTGDTIRRPPSDSTMLVEGLLAHLERVGFDGAPRFLGRDDLGREILSFLPGAVARHRPPVGRKRLESAARLIRRFHDATAGSPLVEGEEVVCHGELGPHNTLFCGSEAVALIDFDTVYPGSRLDDLGHAAWFFVPIGAGGGSVEQQGTRLRILCDGYSDCDPVAVLAALGDRFERVGAWYRERGLEFGEAKFRGFSSLLTAERAAVLAAAGRAG